MNLAKSSTSIFKRDSLIYFVHFITSIIISRKLGLAALGIWSILQLISSYSECFGRTRIELAAIYFIGKKKYKEEDVLASIHFVLFISTILIYLIGFSNFDLIYNMLFKDIEINQSREMSLVILSIPFSFLYISYSYFFIALEDIANYNRIVVIYSSILSSSSIFLLSFTQIGLLGIIFPYLFSPLIASIFAILALPVGIIKNGNHQYKITYSLLKYGLQFYLTSIFAEFQISGTRLITAYLLNPANVAFIAQGQKFTQLQEKLVSPLQTTLLPRISRSSKLHAINITLKAFRVSTIILFLSTIFILLIIRPTIELIYGQEFIPIANVIYIILPGLYFRNLTKILNSYFSGAGKEFVNSTLQIIPTILQLGLSWYLVNKYGFMGGAIAISISMLIFGISYIGFFIYFAKIDLKKLIPKMEDFNYIKDFIISNIKNKL
tara:strand:- start:18003 stop:19313 length:1311 start_codon:yes stop_codon:yes gene_type:complete